MPEADSKGEQEVVSSTVHCQCGLLMVVGGASSSWDSSTSLDGSIPDATVPPFMSDRMRSRGTEALRET